VVGKSTERFLFFPQFPSTIYMKTGSQGVKSKLHDSLFSYVLCMSCNQKMKILLNQNSCDFYAFLKTRGCECHLVFTKEVPV